jgi:predicted nucleotide-binding protein
VSRIFIIDDDLSMDVLGDSLRYRGHEVERIASAQKTLDRIGELTGADIIILDIIMAWPDGRIATGFAGPSTAGMEVLLEVRKRNVNLPVIVYSATQDSCIVEAIAEIPHCDFISKWEDRSLKQLILQVHRALGLQDKAIAAQSFIVHGHDETAKLALKNFLQNTLRFPEPIILHEQPNWGRTIIEKFEDYAALSALVFVLLTPDDLLATGDQSDDVKRRARQNVIFEMGYFLGALGRKSGRVVLLHRGPIELPSDISGVIFIDISGGVEAAGESIRKEVAHATA